MNINSYGKGSIQNLEKIENEFSLILPKEYKDFLIDNNGAEINNGYFFVKEINQLISMGLFYGVDLGKKGADIFYINNEYNDDIPENSLLIGGDDGGGWILLICDGENDGIWYYDHSYFFEQSTDELNTYFICETFTEFLEMLETTKIEDPKQDKPRGGWSVFD
jgi:hypothetical protein